MKLIQERLFNFVLALIGMCVASILQAQGVSSKIVRVSGVLSVSVELPPNHGGTVVPLPHAVFGKEGTLAFKIAVSAFPSNGAVLDLGGKGPDRMLINESYAGGPAPARKGHFRLLISDRQGTHPALDGPMVEANSSHLLAVAWRGGQYEFWVDGMSVGKTQSQAQLDHMPDRFALIEPIGIRWQAIQVWSKYLSYDEVQNRIVKPTFSADTTLLAVRADSQDERQLVSIGPGIMSVENIQNALTKPLARRNLFVDVTNGNDQASGDSAHPYKTIVRAASVAEPGDTVTLMPGVYRESVRLTRSGRPDAPISFRASPAGRVTLDGTDPLSGLVSAGGSPETSLWMKTGFKSRDVVFGDAKTISILKARGPSGTAQLERRGRVDTIWLDGMYIAKAIDRASLRPRTFWVDPDKEELVLALSPGDRPERHLIEIGARGPFFTGDVSYIHLQGFQAFRGDTPYFVGAIAPGLTSSNWVIEDIVESWGNWAGILLHGFGHVVKDSITDQNGDDGIEGTLCEYIILDGNKSRANDWQPDRVINPSWGSGGSKFTQVDHMIVRNYESAFNHGPGIWFDDNNQGVTVEDSHFYHNNVGIMAEISPGAFLFRNNVCFDNEEAGIMVAESGDVTIENNTLVANKYGLELRNVSGRTGAGLAPGQASFEVVNVSIAGNVFADNLAAGFANTFGGLDIARNHIASDKNLFFRNSAMVMWPSKQTSGSTVKMDASNDWTLTEDGKGEIRLLSLDAIHRAIGLEKNSVNTDPHFVMPEASDYRIEVHAPTVSPFGTRDVTTNADFRFLP